MSIIFLDESGYTGQDLMDAVQPIFTLATLCLSEDDCRRLKERFFKTLKSSELKHSRLVRNARNRKLLLDFLQELSKTPELVKVLFTHKRYALVSKLVQYVINPTARKEGVDLRIKGIDLAFTYSIYHELPQVVGEEFVEDFLRRFQQMMMVKSHEAYHLFFDPLFDERYPKVPDKEHQQMIDVLLGSVKKAHTTIGYDLIDQFDISAQSLRVAQIRPLDIALQSTLSLMEKWRKDLTDEIILIHDASSRMAEVFPLWQTFVHPHPPPALLQLTTSNTSSAIGVAKTSLENSKDWIGLQLADLLAGAATWWIKWGEKGASPADEYGRELNTIMQSFQKFALWPPTNPTSDDFEKYGLTEKEALLRDQYHEKLAAFHRIRAYGYSYQVSP